MRPLSPLVLPLALASAVAGAQTSFEGVGDLPGGGIASGACGVSADGAVVIGSSASEIGAEAYRRENGVMVGLYEPPASFFPQFASDVSADGSVVVGTGFVNEAWRWENGAVVPLGFPDAATSSEVSGVSPDGRVIVGRADFDRPYRWENGRYLELLDPFTGQGQSFAADQDGGTVAFFERGPVSIFTQIWELTTRTQGDVGSAGSSGLVDFAAQWFADQWNGDYVEIVAGAGAGQRRLIEDTFFLSGAWQISIETPWETIPDFTSAYEIRRPEVENLGTFGTSLAEPRDITPDARVLAGHVREFNDDFQAFRLVFGQPEELLGDLPGGPVDSRSQAISADGNVIVGFAHVDGPTSDGTQIAMIWEPENGMRDLKGVLEARGLDLAGWTLTTARDISADGITIVGDGINPLGNAEGWVARLPEPRSALAAGMALLTLIGLRGQSVTGRTP